MVTRRCSERRFFLLASKEANQCFVYCLGAAAQKHGIELHWVTSVNNHYHAGMTDHEGNMPLFLRQLHSNIARCMNWRGPTLELRIERTPHGARGALDAQLRASDCPSKQC